MKNLEADCNLAMEDCALAESVTRFIFENYELFKENSTLRREKFNAIKENIHMKARLKDSEMEKLIFVTLAEETTRVNEQIEALQRELQNQRNKAR